MDPSCDNSVKEGRAPINSYISYILSGLTRRRCLKSICGKSEYAQCAVIHSNLRLPLLCRKKPLLYMYSSLHSFSQWGQQRKQGDGGRGDCLLCSAVCRAQGYLPIETHNFGYMHVTILGPYQILSDKFTRT